MEASWLIERLDNPALLKKGDERQLRELIAAYPYFSAPYLLLAKTLKEQNHPAFDQLLPLISLQAFDRKRLFKLIHEERTIAEEKQEEESTVNGQRSTVEVRGLGDEENVLVRHAERSRSKTDDRQPGPRFAVDFTEVEKTEEEPVNAVHDELKEIPFLLTMDHGPWTMEDGEEEGEAGGSTVDSQRSTEDEEIDIVRHAERSRSTTDVPETIEEDESKNHKSQIINHKSDRIDFLHWLEKLQPVEKVEDKAKVEEMMGLGDEENEMARDTERSQSTTDLAETTGLEVSRHGSAPLTMTGDQNPEPLSAEAPAKEDDPNALIDKFIETNPSVSRVKERFYDPAVQAKESERLDDSLMTETLARIFVKQEKYERALEAYKKLQLKYPEKSDYFAALIAEINSKIN